MVVTMEIWVHWSCEAWGNNDPLRLCHNVTSSLFWGASTDNSSLTIRNSTARGTSHAALSWRRRKSQRRDYLHWQIALFQHFGVTSTPGFMHYKYFFAQIPVCPYTYTHTNTCTHIRKTYVLLRMLEHDLVLDEHNERKRSKPCYQSWSCSEHDLLKQKLKINKGIVWHILRTISAHCKYVNITTVFSFWDTETWKPDSAKTLLPQRTL